MVTQLQANTQPDIIYPDSDGQPMADNTKQFRWIVTIQQNLEWLFADDPAVFVAGDLLWYPVEGNNKIRTAPDVLVVFGRPKGDRGSFQQWKEDGIAPQVVFEILSPGNRLTEMNKKQVFYDRYGVEEYYIYDPDENDLSGWLRPQNGETGERGDRLEVIDPIDNWTSPRLGIRFNVAEELQIYRPDGSHFLSYVDIAQRAEQEKQRADKAEARAAQLAERLRAAGIDPDA